ncbi:speckle-type POZ protein-like B [Trichonephila clavipes]|nr:speckle-type POZ protein-like B [Trichonephila clavipes]
MGRVRDKRDSNFTLSKKKQLQSTEPSQDVLSRYEAAYKTQHNSSPTQILGARSSVFKAMFSHDMKEDPECVDAPLTCYLAVENVTHYSCSNSRDEPTGHGGLRCTKPAAESPVVIRRPESGHYFAFSKDIRMETVSRKYEIDFEISICLQTDPRCPKAETDGLHKATSRVLELVERTSSSREGRNSCQGTSSLYDARDLGLFRWDRKTTLLVQPTRKGGPAPRLNIFLEDVENEIVVTIEVEAGTGKERYGFQCEISVLDFEGKAFCTQGVRDFMYGRHEDCLRFSPFITRKELVTNKCVVLPNDVLSLKCAFDIVLAHVSSRLEDYRQFSCFEIEAVVPAVEDVHDEEEDSVSCCPLKKALTSLYEEGTLSDINIRSGTKSFPVHKSILSVRSPVFHAMFGTEMREKTSKDLDLPDVDADTLRCLLLFIYTDTVKDMGWENTSDLYRVADHYEVMDLREKCSTILRSKLNESNVCSVLSLADMYHDQTLKRTVQNFIVFDLSIEFISSEEWKKFKGSNVQLALETMEHVFFKRKIEL